MQTSSYNLGKFRKKAPPTYQAAYIGSLGRVVYHILENANV